MSKSPEQISHLFDCALAGFQLDLVKIITKNRGERHHLDVDELLSDVNLQLIKSKDKIIASFDGEFLSKEFKRLAYTFARNLIKWSQSRLNNASYISKRSNAFFETEEGTKTSFDLACEQVAEEEDADSLDPYRNSKCSYILRMIKDYCYILTEQETKVLILQEQGGNLRQIAKKLGVTHQAISITESNIREKIRAHFNIDPFTDNSSEKVTKGNRSIQDFFASYPKFSKQDRVDLVELIKSSGGHYTGEEISKIFKKGKFTSHQIYSFCAKNGLSIFLKKVSYKNYTAQEENIMIEMIENGCYVENLMMKLNRHKKSINSKLNHLLSAGLIKDRPTSSLKSLSSENKLTLKFFLEGLSTEEVALKNGVSTKSAGATRGSLVLKGLLPPSPRGAGRTRASRVRTNKSQNASMELS